MKDFYWLPATGSATVTDPFLLGTHPSGISYNNFANSPLIMNYSDLEMQQIEIEIGGTYNVTPALYLSATAGVDFFLDDQPYVYGDQEGTMYYGTAGVGYSF